MTEQWRPVVGRALSYEVSSLGRVRGLPRKVWRRAAGKCPAMWINVPARTLRACSATGGWLTLALGSHDTHYVAVLVLEAFVRPRRWQGNRPLDKVVFRDGNRGNCTLANLCYRELAYA